MFHVPLPTLEPKKLKLAGWIVGEATPVTGIDDLMVPSVLAEASMLRLMVPLILLRVSSCDMGLFPPSTSLRKSAKSTC